jgi:hypothetical protein
VTPEGLGIGNPLHTTNAAEKKAELTWYKDAVYGEGLQEPFISERII